MGGMALALVLMYERSLGEKSKFWGYLQSLPQEGEPLPIFWSEEELQLLKVRSLYK